jgi:hypothetical protein
MKNRAPLMTLPKIKWLLRLRLLSFILSIIFTALTLGFTFEKQVMHWPGPVSFLLASACLLLAVVSSAGYLFLHKRLANSGL